MDTLETHPVALVTPTNGFVLVRQNAASAHVFGRLTGRAWMTLPGVSAEVNRRGYRAIEQALDTQRVVRLLTPSDVGEGELTVRPLETGQVLTMWRPVIAHPRESWDLHRIAADLRDLLEELRSCRHSPPRRSSAR